MRLLRPLLVAALAAVAVAPAAAFASFPGANGLLAVTGDTCSGAIDTPHIQAYTASGSRSVELTPRCDRYDSSGSGTFVNRSTFGPDWSPDGRRLLYAQTSGGDQPARFETVAADGSGEQAVSPALFGLTSYNDPSFAPDGKRFAYLDAGKLFVSPGDGGAAALLRDAPGHLSVRWSPTGRHMVVNRRQSAAQTGLFLIDAATGKTVRRVARGYVLGVDWSPDGRHLVFATTYGHDDRTGDITGANVYTVRADGTQAPKLFVRTRKVAAVNPVWSPDGRSIAWVQMDYTAGDVAFRAYPSLWRKSVRSGIVRRITGLPSPRVEEGFHLVPDLAWQARPTR